MKSDLLTLTENAYAQLKKRIKRGEFSSGMLPTEKILQKELEVGLNTLRSAQQKLINDGYIIKIRGKGTFIRDSVKKLQRKKNIAVISSANTPHYEFWRLINESIMENIDYAKYSVLNYSMPVLATRRIQYIKEELATSEFDYLIIYGYYSSINILLDRWIDSIPIISIGAMNQTWPVASITPDYFRALSLALNHLASLNHKRIGCIMSSKTYSSLDCDYTHVADNVEMRISFIKEFAEYHGWPVNRNFFVCVEPGGNDTAAQAAKAAEKMLSLPDRPTAFICFNDLIAKGVMIAAGNKGLRIPADLSIIGCDGLQEMQDINPPLTTIDIGISQLGRRAVELLLTRGAEKDFNMIREITAVKLINGGTCRKI
ncbi:MAG TPA: hypothetical protein DC049_04890 [Spirochaetia bacterium]|nr:hypothetical protein [Spirochaetia bacterium]